MKNKNCRASKTQTSSKRNNSRLKSKPSRMPAAKPRHPVYLQKHLDLLSHEDQCDFAQYICNRAIEAAQSGDVSLAKYRLKQLAKDIPELGEARLLISLVHLWMGDHDQAIANLKEAARLIPHGTILAWPQLGLIEWHEAAHATPKKHQTKCRYDQNFPSGQWLCSFQVHIQPSSSDAVALLCDPASTLHIYPVS
jgi:tetratricopeptide (TPR) repeat protein